MTNMKILFDLRKGKYLGYEATAYNIESKQYPNYPGQSYYHEVDEFSIKMKNLFQSISILRDGPRMFIDFEDPADEAHFILWASDGIEI